MALAFLCGSLIFLPVLLLLLNNAEFSNVVSLSIQNLPGQDFLRLSDTLVDRLPKRLEVCAVHLLTIACLFLIWKTVLSVQHMVQEWAERQDQAMSADMVPLKTEIKNRRKNIMVLRQQLKWQKRIGALAKLESKELKRNEDSDKARIKELGEHFSDLENWLSSSRSENETLKECVEAHSTTGGNYAEVIYGLRETIDRERLAHQHEVMALKSQLERKANEMQEMERTLRREVAQKEAVRVEVKRELAVLANGIQRMAEVQESWMKELIRFRQKKAHNNLMAVIESQIELAREKNKCSRLRRTYTRLKRIFLLMSAIQLLIAADLTAIPDPRER